MLDQKATTLFCQFSLFEPIKILDMLWYSRELILILLKEKNNQTIFGTLRLDDIEFKQISLEEITMVVLSLLGV